MGRAILRLLAGDRRHLRIEGLENVPTDGPLVVVSNHISNLDPLLFGGYFPRTLFAMAKREMYGQPLVAWWLAGCNCLPVDRSAPDRRAVSMALEILRNRGRLLVFVEGTRSRTAAMQHPEPGAGFLVRRSGARVQPVAIWGTEQARGARMLLGRRPRITMRYGVPFTVAPAGRGEDQAIAEELGRRIAALLPPRYRGVYADSDLTGWESSSPSS